MNKQLSKKQPQQAAIQQPKVEVAKEKTVQKVQEVPQAVPTEVGVVRVVQKRPAHYNLLLETGETVIVHKDLYVRGQKTIKL